MAVAAAKNATRIRRVAFLFVLAHQDGGAAGARRLPGSVDFFGALRPCAQRGSPHGLLRRTSDRIDRMV
ncbi:hypothetical protein [Burkholderia mayonis]|uniref:hypothetical protein n=1 Tax=Burkholderia mayonis TaxID=1385591 RepID=UPI00131EE367|nr:hypothetical protein [Burkholderia mayonis]